MAWVEHAVWWHVYPLGLTGAPIREPDAAALALVVLMTVGGVPSVYYGDEWGLPASRRRGSGATTRSGRRSPPHRRSCRGGADLPGPPGPRRAAPPAPVARRRPDGRADHDEQRYVYASSDGSSSLTVELDVTAAPTARVLDQDGAVLVRWGG